MRRKFNRSIVLLSIGDDMIGAKGEIAFEPREAYSSIEQALNEFYNLYISTVSKVQMMGILRYAHIDQDFNGTWWFSVVADDRTPDGFITMGELTIIDLLD